MLKRVTATQVAGRLLGIAKNENLRVDGETVFKIATIANGDIRQMLNMMQMYHVTNKHMGSSDVASLTSKESGVSLFDVLPQLMNKESYCKLSLNDKIQLYFTDSSLIPLFVQVCTFILNFPFVILNFYNRIITLILVHLKQLLKLNQ